jgi:hypothetical protein
MTSQERVLAAAKQHGWEASWIHKLLTLSSWRGEREYMVQVLLKDGNWDYALTWSRRRSGVGESQPTIVRNLGNLLIHLQSPSDRHWPTA